MTGPGDLSPAEAAFGHVGRRRSVTDPDDHAPDDPDDRVDELASTTHLTDTQAAVFVLAFERGNTESTVADVLDVEVGTVRSHKGRIRSKIRHATALTDAAADAGFDA